MFTSYLGHSTKAHKAQYSNAVSILPSNAALQSTPFLLATAYAAINVFNTKCKLRLLTDVSSTDIVMAGHINTARHSNPINQ